MSTRSPGNVEPALNRFSVQENVKHPTACRQFVRLQKMQANPVLSFLYLQLNGLHSTQSGGGNPF